MFQRYYAARLAPLIALTYALHRVIPTFKVQSSRFDENASRRRTLTEQWRGLLTAALAALLFVAPLSVVFVANREAFTSRTSGVWLFTPSNLAHELGAYRVSRVEDVLKIQAQRTFEAFNLSGESSLQYGHRAPLLDFWTNSLLLIGVVAVLAHLRQSRYFLLFVWSGLTLIFGSVLTVDAPFAPRIVAVIPALTILAALVIEAGWRAAASSFGRSGTYGFGLPVMLFLALSAQDNYRDYFEEHVLRMQPAGFFTELSSFIRSVNDSHRVYLLGRADTSLRYDTPRFLVPEMDAVDVRDQPLRLPLERVPTNKGVVFVIESAAPNQTERLDAVRRAYPAGREQIHRNSAGAVLFTSYAVEPVALMAANPGAVRD